MNLSMRSRRRTISRGRLRLIKNYITSERKICFSKICVRSKKKWQVEILLINKKLIV